MWTHQGSTGTMVPGARDEAAVGQSSAGVGKTASLRWFWGRGSSSTCPGETSTMVQRDDRDDQSGGPPDVDLVLDSDAWQHSLPVTVWAELKKADRQSVEQFARRYGTAVFCYFRRRGLKREDAKDLTIDFILAKLIKGDLIGKFKPGQHRFRSYLLQALRNHLTDHHRREGRRRVVALEQALEEGPDAQPASEEQAELAFIRACVHDQIKAAIRRVKSESQRDGLEDHFKILCRRHFTNPRPGWEAIGRDFGISWQEAKNKAWTIQQRLKKALLGEFRMQGMTEAQIKEEVQELIGLFLGHAGTELLSSEGPTR